VYGQEGYYLDLIVRYLAYFPRDSMLILLYDDLLESPLSVIRTVYEFLGVDAGFVPPSGETRINETEVVSSRTQSVLTLDSEMRARMHQIYEDHNRRLGGFLGRDLSFWNTGMRAPDR
jgi:hypothetical protein